MINKNKNKYLYVALFLTFFVCNKLYAEEVQTPKTITTITENQKIIESTTESSDKKNNDVVANTNIDNKTINTDNANDKKEIPQIPQMDDKINNKSDLIKSPLNILNENKNNNTNLPIKNDENQKTTEPLEEKTLQNLEKQVIQQSIQQEITEKNEIEKQNQESTKKILEELKQEELKAEKENIQDATKQPIENIITQEQKQNDALNTKVKPSKEEKTQKTEKQTSQKDQNTYNVEKLFTVFDVKKALNFDYNTIKYDNFNFLENNEELKEIKKVLKEQSNPELVKKREKEDKIKAKMQTKMQTAIIKPIDNILKVYSLVYINDNDWKAKINNTKIDANTKNDKMFNGTSVVKANKTSIIFLLHTPNKLVETVKKIQNEKGSYSKNYYLVQENNDTYIAFKLFIGQRINLDTMKISG